MYAPFNRSAVYGKNVVLSIENTCIPVLVMDSVAVATTARPGSPMHVDQSPLPMIQLTGQMGSGNLNGRGRTTRGRHTEVDFRARHRR